MASGSVDVVYDCVGQTGTGDRAMDKLRPSTFFGYYVTITGALARSTKAGITQNEFINSDTNLNNVPVLSALTRLAEDDKLRMKHIDSSFGLQAIEKAFARSATHLVVGKISIAISNATAA